MVFGGLKMRSTKDAVLRHTTTGLALTTALILPLGCGVVYTSPSVKEAVGNEVNVREIKLTPQSVLLANRTPYSPRNLPSEFFTSASAQQGPGLGAFPRAARAPDESPQSEELRIPPEVPATPYRIGIGDVVLLATKGGGTSVEELSGLLAAQQQRQGYTVSDDGSISIPDIGRVEIGGLTLQEAQERVFKYLLDNQLNPAVSLEVAEFNSQRVTVGGAVRNAMRIPITLVPLTLGDALAASGGEMVQDEQITSIRIYRGGALYQIPYDDYLSRPDIRNLRLADGDAVEILASDISLRRGMLQERRSNFEARTELGAEPRDYVYLTGEVGEQNRIPLPYEQQTTLADVLYGNGGFPTETGNASHIYVLRPSADPSEFGAVTAWHLDAANTVNLTLATHMQMRPNDIVFIEEQPITKWGRSLQQFLPTLINTAGRTVTN
jgi:polysaccharide export outer membrane protein